MSHIPPPTLANTRVEAGDLRHYVKDFVEENEDLIRGSVPDNDGEALFWFGRAMWNTIYSLSLQSRFEDEPNFQPMIEFLNNVAG